MKFEIKHVGDHYELWVNDQFHSSHDSIPEATREIELLREESA